VLAGIAAALALAGSPLNGAGIALMVASGHGPGAGEPPGMLLGHWYW